MIDVVVLLTCFNRRKKTENCIRSLSMENLDINMYFVVVDGGSTDGTIYMIEELSKKNNIIIHIGENLYYSNGMRLAMQILKSQNKKYDYVMLVNDDVMFFNDIIVRLSCCSKEKDNAIIVGPTCDRNGNYTYGAIKYIKGITYRNIGPEESDLECDTFNANCVLIPGKIFDNSEIIDGIYKHSLGDFDYGFLLKKSGYNIYSANFYVGICERNVTQGVWSDKSLSRKERLKKKEEPKGLPFKQWFHYLNKNFGVLVAVWHSITPYIKILIRR